MKPPWGPEESRTPGGWTKITLTRQGILAFQKPAIRIPAIQIRMCSNIHKIGHPFLRGSGYPKSKDMFEFQCHYKSHGSDIAIVFFGTGWRFFFDGISRWVNFFLSHSHPVPQQWNSDMRNCLRIWGCIFSLMDTLHYRVDHNFSDLGWVDLDLVCSTTLLGQ